MNAIEVEKLSRTFNGLKAVDNISFSVEAGEIFGFLGHNGAGKTTTIRMLSGQLLPTSGHARVAGCDVITEQRRLKPLIGVVSEHQNLYERMSGRENLEFAVRLYGQDVRRVNETLKQVDLLDRAKDNVRTYSNGMKQRLLIARALLHRPQIIFLDEPTRGLDPVVGREIRRLILDLSQQGVTIFLTTHYMEEADQLCGRVAFLSEGRMVALDTPNNLKVAHGHNSVKVTLENGESLSIDLNDRDAGKQLEQLVSAGHVRTLHTAEATLEEVFIQMAGRELSQ
ncbi:MAG TPA: ABC transporter ATP-binding protein [Pyrinomonadaceae bacterium]|jgi:ABC-2 type transport system ATP-binding protein|nr:ABC transporter ATP-binding protein [Pyrinomonadaceae bacterium]